MENVDPGVSSQFRLNILGKTWIVRIFLDRNNLNSPDNLISIFVDVFPSLSVKTRNG